MGLSPFMQSLYEAQSQNAARQQAQIQNQQQAEEMARQAYRDAFQQHYQEELLKLQQQKAQQENDPNSIANKETIARTNLLTQQAANLQKPDTEREDKQQERVGQYTQQNLNQGWYDQTSAQYLAKRAAGVPVTPEETDAFLKAQQAAGRVSPAQGVEVKPETQKAVGTGINAILSGALSMAGMGPGQAGGAPAPFGPPAPNAPPQGPPNVMMGNVPSTLTQNLTPQEMLDQALGLPSPAAEAAKGLKAAQTVATEMRAKEAQSRIDRNAETIKNIQSEISTRDWRRQYIPLRDAAARKLTEVRMAAQQNRWLQGFQRAENKDAFMRAHTIRQENRQDYRQAISLGQATGAAIQRYISPLNTEWQRANSYLDRLTAAQRTVNAELQRPRPDPKDPQYTNNPTAYANDVKQYQQWEAQNLALWGPTKDGSQGLIGQTKARMDALKEEMDPYKTALMNLPNTVIKGKIPALVGTPPPKGKGKVDYSQMSDAELKKALARKLIGQ